MVTLPLSIPLEGLAGLLEQFWCHSQINLRVRQANVPKIDGEVVHQSLDIGSFAVPLRQAVYRKSVPKVV
jgi:hypothetical protein